MCNDDKTSHEDMTLSFIQEIEAPLWVWKIEALLCEKYLESGHI